MTNSGSNWLRLSDDELKTKTDYSKLLKELSDCICENKKTKINLKILKLKSKMKVIADQVSWSNNFLIIKKHPLPFGKTSWSATDIVYLIKGQKTLSAEEQLTIISLKKGWRQAKKGKISTVEITASAKNKLEKLAKKRGVYMKDYTTELILEHAKNEKYKQKYDAAMLKMSKLEHDIKSNKFEENRAHHKISKLITNYKKLLKKNVELQVRYESLSENSFLPKLNIVEKNMIKERFDFKLKKCEAVFLYYKKNNLKLK